MVGGLRRGIAERPTSCAKAALCNAPEECPRSQSSADADSGRARARDRKHQDSGELIIADLSPKGYKEISRAKIIAPTQPNYGRDVVWCHPAYAKKCVFVRNDKEIVCVSLKG